MQNREIIANLCNLNKFSQDKLPVKLTYAIARNIKMLNAAVETFDEIKKKLLDEYAIKDSEGNIEVDEHDSSITVKDGKGEEFSAKVKELLDIDVNINVHMVPFEVVESLNLSVTDMFAIDFMLDAPKE